MKKILAILLSVVSVICDAFAVGCNKDKNEEIVVRGKHYLLREAYDNGWLDEDDLKSIACGYYEFFQFDKYSEYENLYNGLFVSPEKLSAKKEKELKLAYLKEIGYSEFSVDGVHITQYYGNYNGNIVAGFSCDYIAIDIKSTEKYEIGGVIFYKFWEGKILVYHRD